VSDPSGTGVLPADTPVDGPPDAPSADGAPADEPPALDTVPEAAPAVGTESGRQAAIEMVKTTANAIPVIRSAPTFRR
jgi:hypothetical protein